MMGNSSTIQHQIAAKVLDELNSCFETCRCDHRRVRRAPCTELIRVMPFEANEVRQLLLDLLFVVIKRRSSETVNVPDFAIAATSVAHDQDPILHMLSWTLRKHLAHLRQVDLLARLLRRAHKFRQDSFKILKDFL